LFFLRFVAGLFLAWKRFRRPRGRCGPRRRRRRATADRRPGPGTAPGLGRPEPAAPRRGAGSRPGPTAGVPGAMIPWNRDVMVM